MNKQLSEGLYHGLLVGASTGGATATLVIAVPFVPVVLTAAPGDWFGLAIFGLLLLSVAVPIGVVVGSVIGILLGSTYSLFGIERFASVVTATLPLIGAVTLLGFNVVSYAESWVFAVPVAIFGGAGWWYAKISAGSCRLSWF